MDTDKYDEVLKFSQQLDNDQISDLCNAASLEKVDDLALYTPEIHAFEVDDEVMAIIPELKR